jgi:outer membrane protein TolC
MEHSTFNIQRRTSMVRRAFGVNRVQCWALNVECSMFFAALLFAAGCATYQPQPVAPGKTAAQWESRRLDDAGLRKFLEQNLGHELKNWPETNWDLPELTLVAFYYHPSLAVARAQWLVAAAGLKTAGARPNPSVSATPGYDAQIPGNYSPWLVPVTFDLPIETAGKRGLRLAEAGKIAESARENFVAAAWQIRSGVRAGLLDFKIAGRRAGLLEQELAAQQEMARRLQQRFDAGEISRPELAAAQIALNKTRLDWGEAQSGRAAARSRLAEALGLGQAALDGAGLDFDFSPPDAATLTSAAARRVALRSRADILAALADYAAAEADLRLQVARQYPDLHLGPGYAWNSGNAGDNQWSLGLTLELPVLDQNQGPIAEAAARRKLAAAKFLERQAQVVGEIDRAVAGFRVTGEQWRTGQELLAAEQRQQQSVAAQRQAGADDSLDGLSAQLEWHSAQLAQLDNQAKLQAAYGALEDALQCPADALAAVIQKISTESPDPFSK